jgi:peptidoglycan hydrolase-like protein with peptidoglycan-binding domain
MERPRNLNSLNYGEKLTSMAYGPATNKAVSEYQKAQGLKSTAGRAGDVSWIVESWQAELRTLPIERLRGVGALEIIKMQPPPGPLWYEPRWWSSVHPTANPGAAPEALTKSWSGRAIDGLMAS